MTGSPRPRRTRCVAAGARTGESSFSIVVATPGARRTDHVRHHVRLAGLSLSVRERAVQFVEPMTTEQGTGDYTLYVGTSADDTPHTATVHVEARQSR